jgi:hypothetical protein
MAACGDRWTKYTAGLSSRHNVTASVASLSAFTAFGAAAQTTGPAAQDGLPVRRHPHQPDFPIRPSFGLTRTKRLRRLTPCRQAPSFYNVVDLVNRLEIGLQAGGELT